MTENLFDGAEVIYAYTVSQAVEDDILVDANSGDLAEVTRQHSHVPLYMSVGVFGLMEKAVDHPRWNNDFRGIWHDILTMSASARYRGGGFFRVIITGTGRKRIHTLKVGFEGFSVQMRDPVGVICLPEED